MAEAPPPEHPSPEPTSPALTPDGGRVIVTDCGEGTVRVLEERRPVVGSRPLLIEVTLCR